MPGRRNRRAFRAVVAVAMAVALLAQASCAQILGIGTPGAAPDAGANGPVNVVGTFVGGAGDQSGAIELHGAFSWHGAIGGAKDGITLEGWLR